MLPICRFFLSFPSHDIELRCVWIGPVRIRHSSHDFTTQSSHVVDRAGWQAKMASIEFWIPWRNAHRPIEGYCISKNGTQYFCKLLMCWNFSSEFSSDQRELGSVHQRWRYHAVHMVCLGVSATRHWRLISILKTVFWKSSGGKQIVSGKTIGHCKQQR